MTLGYFNVFNIENFKEKLSSNTMYKTPWADSNQF